MLDTTCINNALAGLFIKSYQIQRLDYEENHFGNFIIELASKESFGIRFVCDRGQVWCKVHCGSEWLLINDIFAIIGISFSYDLASDYCVDIESISNAIEQNLPVLKIALDKVNFKTTLQRVEELKNKRHEVLMKKYSNN